MHVLAYEKVNQSYLMLSLWKIFHLIFCDKSSHILIPLFADLQVYNHQIIEYKTIYYYNKN